MWLTEQQATHDSGSNLERDASYIIFRYSVGISDHRGMLLPREVMSNIDPGIAFECNRCVPVQLQAIAEPLDIVSLGRRYIVLPGDGNVLDFNSSRRAK